MILSEDIRRRLSTHIALHTDHPNIHPHICNKRNDFYLNFKSFSKKLTLPATWYRYSIVLPRRRIKMKVKVKYLILHFVLEGYPSYSSTKPSVLNTFFWASFACLSYLKACFLLQHINFGTIRLLLKLQRIIRQNQRKSQEFSVSFPCTVHLNIIHSDVLSTKSPKM